MENFETLRKRLLYQSQHRGMREMDFLLGGFAQKYLKEMSLEELKLFEGLLVFPDQTLYACFFERVPLPSPEFNPIIDAIRSSIET